MIIITCTPAASAQFPKKHSADKWRLILDMSHPKGSSINDGIDKQLCSLSYIKVDDVVQHIIALGRGCKLDIESAFRNIPVHPMIGNSLACNGTNIDTVLPFGLRSAPQIFNCIAATLQWIARHYGMTFLEHFLDDFITAGAPNTNECETSLYILMIFCCILGLPLATEKREGTATCLTFLGLTLASG